MKRLIPLLVAVLLILSACSKGAPEGMSKDAYKYGSKALEILKDFNDGKISGSDASSRLTDLSQKITNLESGDQYYKDPILAGQINIANLAVSNFRNYNAYDEQEDLEELLGK